MKKSALLTDGKPLNYFYISKIKAWFFLLLFILIENATWILDQEGLAKKAIVLVVAGVGFILFCSLKIT